MIRNLIISTKADYLMFVLDFMCSWFGEDKNLSEISKTEFARVYNLLFIRN